MTKSKWLGWAPGAAVIDEYPGREVPKQTERTYGTFGTEQIGEGRIIREQGAQVIQEVSEHEVPELTKPLTGRGPGCPGERLCNGCYRLGVVAGTMRWAHPPKGKALQWLQ